MSDESDENDVEFVTIEGYENARVPLHVIKARDDLWREMERRRMSLIRAENAYDNACVIFRTFSGRTLADVEADKRQAEAEAARRQQREPMRSALTIALRQTRENQERMASQRPVATDFRVGDIVWIDSAGDYAPARVCYVGDDGVGIHWPGQSDRATSVAPFEDLSHASLDDPRVVETMNAFRRFNVFSMARG